MFLRTPFIIALPWQCTEHPGYRTQKMNDFNGTNLRGIYFISFHFTQFRGDRINQILIFANAKGINEITKISTRENFLTLKYIISFDSA